MAALKKLRLILKTIKQKENYHCGHGNPHLRFSGPSGIIIPGYQVFVVGMQSVPAPKKTTSMV